MIKKLLNILDIKTTNDKLLLTLSFMLFMPLLFDFIFAVTKGNSAIYSMIIYGLSLIVIFFEFRKLISLGNIFLILGIYLLFGLNMFIFPDSQEYFFRPQMYVLYAFSIPINFLIIVKIKDWSSFFRIMAYFGFVSIFMSAAVILYVMSIPDLVADGVFSYMEFSYALSPLICALFARFLETNKYVYLIAFIAGLAEMIAYSSRAALIFAIMFVVVAEVFYYKQRKRRFFIFLLIILVGLYFSSTIINKVEESSYFDVSYAINQFLTGEGVTSSSREYIYKLCRQRIDVVGVDIYGFFGDRPYCGSVYPHNLVYEVVMQFGTLFGSIALFILLLFIIRSYINSANKLIVVFFVLTIFAKYFFSDSYLESGKFWIFLGVLLSQVSKRKTKRNECISG